MGEGSKVIHKRRKIILATVGVLTLNALLSITLTNVTPDHAGTQTTSWNEIFIYARQFSILMYVLYLSTLFEKAAKMERRIVEFTVAHADIIFLCVIFIYLALYEIYCAYFLDYYISPDSSMYMREASSILEGNGFYVDKLAGYDTWFANWPIGYPALIAFFTLISGHSVYLASKLLAIALVGAGLFALYLRFKEDAWIFSLIYLNIGFLSIYVYTWSENPFIFSLIIWGIALSAIVEEPEPKRRWYVITVLGILGAFLTRYFGIVTILFTGFCLLLYILNYLVKNRDAVVLSKIKALFCVEIVSSVLSGLYLFMNRIMAGRISGVERLSWNDDYNELIDNLYNALTREISNATRVDIVSLMPGFYPQGRATVVILLLVVLWIVFHRNYQKEKRLDYKIIFSGAGFFYYLVFIIVRFHSSMDDFNLRFFAPAGMMISIGILGLIKDKFKGGIKKFQIVMCLFLSVLCVGLIQNIKYCTIETSAYYTSYEQLMNSVASVHSKGVILNCADESAYQLMAFRPDIMSSGQITYDDTMETIISRYDKSDSIWIRRDVLNQIINDKNYSTEIRNAFSQYVEDGADEMEYIQVY